MRSILIYLLISYPILLFGSSSDSLRMMLGNRDTTGVQAYYQIGKSFYPKKIDSLYYYYDQGITLAESIKDHMGLAIILRSKGVVQGLNGQGESGVLDLERALEIIKKNNLPPIETINTLINLGVTHHKLGNTGKFLECNITAEQLIRQHGPPSKLKQVRNNIAVAYRVLGKYDDAIRIYEQVLVERMAVKDSLGMGNIFHNLSICYSFMGNHDKTLDYITQALDIFKSIGRTADHNIAQIAYGDALINLEQYEEAIPILEKAKAGDMSKANLGNYASLYIELARAYTEVGRYQESSIVLAEIKDHVLGSDLESYKGDYYLLRSKNQQQINNYKESNLALQEYIKIQSQLASQENIEKQQEMEVKYLALEKDLEIERQNTRLDQSRKQKIFLGSGVVGLAGISLLLFNFLRLRRNNNLILAEKNKIATESLLEKETLLNEIHHRVKNNLQVISSLLSLQSRKVKDKSAYNALQESQNRVRSMALIHQNFYQKGNHVSVNTADYISQLATNLVHNYQIGDAKVHIHTDIDEINLDVDQIIPLGLIINELISNSLKHGKDLNRDLEIEVKLKKEGAGLNLEVSDNGNGLPADFDIDQLDSLGYRLIRSFSKKLKANLNMWSDSGTRVSLAIPKIKYV